MATFDLWDITSQRVTWGLKLSWDQSPLLSILLGLKKAAPTSHPSPAPKTRSLKASMAQVSTAHRVLHVCFGDPSPPQFQLPPGKNSHPLFTCSYITGGMGRGRLRGGWGMGRRTVQKCSWVFARVHLESSHRFNQPFCGKRREAITSILALNLNT